MAKRSVFRSLGCFDDAHGTFDTLTTTSRRKATWTQTQ